MTHSDRCGDVCSVILALEVARDAVGNGARVVFGCEVFALGSHRVERGILLGDECVTSILGQEVEELALATAHALFTAETFEVCTADVGDDAIVGFGNRCEQRNLATGACAHLDNAKFGLVVHRKQSQRNADMVVEVASGGVNLETLGQYAADELLGCGLAVAAHDADNRDSQAAAMLECQGLKRCERILDTDNSLRKVGALGEGLIRVGNGVLCTLIEGCADELIAVK